MHLSGILSRLLDQNLPFACYRLPSDPLPVLLPDARVQALTSVLQAKGKKGFLVVPFQAHAADPVLFFSSPAQYRGWIHDKLQVSEKRLPAAFPDEPAFSADYATYAAQAQKLIALLGQGKLNKVVLSRVICQGLPSGFQAGELFSRLCLEYPNAFVYFFNDAAGHCWMGASPELLLQARANAARTVSLAATRPSMGEDASGFNWSQKETTEQKLVSQYILEVLKASGISDIRQGPLQSIPAGPVVHLRTTFDFSLPPALEPLELARRLHPTPAVCGLPPDTALELINKTELHPRSYYTGFLGPMNENADLSLFVNLRCLQLTAAHACIYAGGGLLAESLTLQEWQETEKKAETLLKMLQK